jgi:hypothetical protein
LSRKRGGNILLAAPNQMDLFSSALVIYSDVGGDIRQFRHTYQLAGCTRNFATSLF